MQETNDSTLILESRDAAGLSQSDLAKALGISQPVISRAERGVKVNEALVAKIKELGVDGIRKAYEAATKPKTETDEPVKPKKGKPKRGKARAVAKIPAIVLELRAFCKKHSLSIEDMAGELDCRPKIAAALYDNKVATIPKWLVEFLRKGMRDYAPVDPKQFTPAPPGKKVTTVLANGDSIPVEEDDDAPLPLDWPIDRMEFSVRTANILFNAGCKTLGDITKRTYMDFRRTKRCGTKTIKEIEETLAEEGYSLAKGTPGFVMGQFKGPIPPPAAKPPTPTPPPPAPPAPPAPKVPRIKLVTTGGIRINNGDNVAPHLKIDGKTMHVFTLVPGGVYISHVVAEME